MTSSLFWISREYFRHAYVAPLDCAPLLKHL